MKQKGLKVFEIGKELVPVQSSLAITEIRDEKEKNVFKTEPIVPINCTKTDIGKEREGKEDAETEIEAEEKEEEEEVFSLWKCIFLATGFVKFALIAGVLGSFVFLVPHFGQRALVSNYRVDTSKNESVILIPEHERGYFEYICYNIQFDFILFYYWPIGLISCVIFPRKRQVAIIFLSIFTSHLIFTVVRWYLGADAVVTIITSMLPIATFVLSLKLVVPRDSNLPIVMTRILICMAGAFIFIACLKAVSNSDSSRLVIVLIAFPIFRETSYFFVRSQAFQLILSAGIGGTGLNQVRVQHEKCWFIFLWMQITAATMIRIYFIRVTEKSMLILLVFVQTVTEIVLRATMKKRDQLIKGVFLKCHRKGAIVPEEVPTKVVFVEKKHHKPARSRMKIETESDEKCCINTFYSFLLVGEMISEIAAIILATCYLILIALLPTVFDVSILLVPLPFFQSDEYDVFDEPPHLSPIFVWCACQLATEVFADSISMFLEIRQGFKVQNVWRNRPKNLLFILFGASWFGIAVSTVLLSFRDSLINCQNMDLCHCVNNGLENGGLRENYCQRLYPPFGIPPS